MAYVFLKDIQNMPDAYSIVIKFQALIQARFWTQTDTCTHIYMHICVYMFAYISAYMNMCALVNGLNENIFSHR